MFNYAKKLFDLYVCVYLNNYASPTQQRPVTDTTNVTTALEINSSTNNSFKDLRTWKEALTLVLKSMRRRQCAVYCRSR